MERLIRTPAENCAAELENLRRMQRIRANEPVAELGEDTANQADKSRNIAVANPHVEKNHKIS